MDGKRNPFENIVSDIASRVSTNMMKVMFLELEKIDFKFGRALEQDTCDAIKDKKREDRILEIHRYIRTVLMKELSGGDLATLIFYLSQSLVHVFCKLAEPKQKFPKGGKNV